MSTPHADPFELARAEAMLRGYDARWGDEQYETLAVEVEFFTSLRNPETGAASRTWRLGGKIDAIVRDESGRVLIVEHKTAAAEIGPGSEYWKRLRLDGQVSIYYEGARSLGFDVEGCLYDVLAKPALRPYKATPPESRKYTKDGRLYATQRDRDETPEEYRARLIDAIAEDPTGYYQRGEVVRLESEMADALHDVWQLAKQIRESELAKRYPRNPDSCASYGRTCPYFAACCGEASLDDSSLFRRSEAAHAELSESANDRLLTSSRLKAARACQRLHRFKYVDGIRPAVEPEALRFGSLVHLGLEAWWKAPAGERLEAALAAIYPAAPAVMSAAATL
jgi:hypothetical protein